MTDAYDTLMDHLAALAVAAVQQPQSAVQAYWLMLASQPKNRHTSLTLAAVSAHAPDWARSYVLQALQHLCQQGPWCEPGAWRAVEQSHGDSAAASRLLRTWPWMPGYRLYLDEVHEATGRVWCAACALYGPRPWTATACPTEVLRGLVLFDAGLYFACHEYFETLWGRTADAASDFYQGLIQIAVAMRHLESHNVRGARILLGYGMQRLQGYPAVYKNLPVAAWLGQLSVLLGQLESLNDPLAYQFDALQIPPLMPQAEERV